MTTILGNYQDVIRAIGHIEGKQVDKADHWSISEKIREEVKGLVLTNEQIKRWMRLFDKYCEDGLAKESDNEGALPMLPSYVRSVPNGTEVGDFLALDLGGTNFRVLLIRLDGKEAKMDGKIFRVPETIMRGSGEALFDHIADCMAKFLGEHGLHNAKQLPLGFTFSFPCKQEGLTRGSLIQWKKGFNASGVEGKDVVTLLREACARRRNRQLTEDADVLLDIDVVALLNDGVGTLMACAFNDTHCQLAVIVGTGTNACYMETLSKIEKVQGEVDADDGLPAEMIVNTEWGSFGNDGVMDFCRTEFDHRVDRDSLFPGRGVYEKMLSGMYLGEIVRVALEHLTAMGLLFSGNIKPISKPGCFPTKYLSEIEGELLHDDELTFHKTQQILEDIGIHDASLSDCGHVAYVCQLVSTRAAHITAAGIACLLNRMDKRKVTVGVDGSVYRFHPTFPRLLDQKIGELVRSHIEYKLQLSEDGSGRGAALVAAVATRMKLEREMSSPPC